MASFGNLPAGDGVHRTASMSAATASLVGDTDDGDVAAFGDDLDIGMSKGSFGEASGAGPEVKLCSVSTDYDDCATFGVPVGDRFGQR